MLNWFSENSVAFTGMGGFAGMLAALVAVVMLVETGANSSAQTRPYVVVEYEIPEAADRMKVLELVVRNAGRTPARNLKAIFTPSFDDSHDPSNLGAYVYRRFKEPVDVLGPGQRLTSLLSEEGKGDEKIPESLTVTVTYSSPLWPHRKYSDTYKLQRKVYTQQLFV